MKNEFLEKNCTKKKKKKRSENIRNSIKYSILLFSTQTGVKCNRLNECLCWNVIILLMYVESINEYGDTIICFYAFSDSNYDWLTNSA